MSCMVYEELVLVQMGVGSNAPPTLKLVKLISIDPSLTRPVSKRPLVLVKILFRM